MAYSTSFPPVLVTQPMAFGRGSTFGSTVGSTLCGAAQWIYCSSHTQAEIGTSDFVTNGQTLGMRPGDGLLNMQISGKHSYHRVVSLTSTSVTFSAGLCISSAS